MMQKLAGVPLVEYVFKRCSVSQESSLTAVITSEDPTDDILAAFCEGKGIGVFRGDLDNVLRRYVAASDFFGLDLVGRVCGDSPFVDTYLIDELFHRMDKEVLEYATPIKERCIPGLDSEVVRSETLKKILDITAEPEDFEHVTLYIKKHLNWFKSLQFDVDLKPHPLEKIHLTVDYIEDLTLCRKIVDIIGGYDFTSADIIDVLRTHPELQTVNHNVRLDGSAPYVAGGKR